jgi:lipopolysaccharide biosynthesis glycosyltransferase
LLMDLATLRNESSVKVLFETTCANAERLLFPDQDVINIVFDGRIKEVPAIWNCADGYSVFRNDVIQWHFQCQTQKPWCNLWKNITWIPYLKYLRKTPYLSEVFRFVWGHIKGLFYFKYSKKGVTRHLICGVRVWRSTYH